MVTALDQKTMQELTQAIARQFLAAMQPETPVKQAGGNGGYVEEENLEWSNGD